MSSWNPHFRPFERLRGPEKSAMGACSSAPWSRRTTFALESETSRSYLPHAPQAHSATDHCCFGLRWTTVRAVSVRPRRSRERHNLKLSPFDTWRSADRTLSSVSALSLRFFFFGSPNAKFSAVRTSRSSIATARYAFGGTVTGRGDDWPAVSNRIVAAARNPTP